MNPAPGSAIEAAREFGIDLSLLIGRVRALQKAMLAFEQIRGAAQNLDKQTKD